MRISQFVFDERVPLDACLLVPLKEQFQNKLHTVFTWGAFVNVFLEAASQSEWWMSREEIFVAISPQNVAGYSDALLVITAATLEETLQKRQEERSVLLPHSVA